MGLDQYANTVTRRGQQLRAEMLKLKTNEERRAFSKEHNLPDEVQQIQYWRKHANLNEWMTQLAVRRGIVKSAHDFNCVDLVLTPQDIDNLEEAICSDDLPTGAGFFWGRSAPEDRVLDEEFISKARRAFARGDEVIYSCWW